MFLKTSSLLSALMVLATALAIALPDPSPAPVEVIVEGQDTVIFENIQCGNEHQGLKPICPHLNTTEEHGCVRYVKGFDVTGVVTEVDLTFPEIQDACDCIQACLNRPGTCAAYVWKFSTPASVTAGHRTCTLYSQFNLPAQVAIAIDVANTTNMNINSEELVANGNNPQMGALVAQTFMDANLNTTADPAAVSGEVWQLSTGKAIC
ncbi:uncharacterized protein LY89DRAFT_682229 [Mollisia scopiformis]|uniref:Apple domain-containing protein n=1 Tax=Mollisia scopiformis TaxID=149040 RepID=A0A194XJV3_MOLSC|nr:uncharacterized protein LY89DRAFT_682229 [Mollisia scopiformis]KUJ20505.1 hypothetical protein LY89DRAFT_682229 [Mollisia scopiformis]